ncbi:SpoIIE family protein phosphatase [Candidatus Uabimicrobium amorphum]|uniref:guanylate cyclase n=1 Tax=Uabimicrobium amorphum TaxID=2596890 RepID=A0A5S9F5J7_UABAM|nr:SpoIIE family protein phosphatase [Candidatus Uabimicrobium amorphum]BBM86916.1 serine phosphatase [Candidatus Uabimicrobium amorphum]
MAGIFLSPQDLHRVFPFHIAFDQQLQITQLGPHVTKLCPNVQLEDLLTNHFVVKRPCIPLTFTSLIDKLQTPYVLKSLDNHCELKGEMLYLKEQEAVIFLCTPNVLDLASLQSLDISLNDFPIHSAVNDFLFLLQTQKVALEDARKLAEKLSLQNEELKKREQALKKTQREKEILQEQNVHCEMQIAFNIQQSLLFGKIPQDIPGLHIEVMAIPSQNVSGDFYDFFSHNTKCLDIVIGDVMGKGIPAALVAAAIKSRLLRFASQGIYIDDYELLPPKEIIQQLQQEVSFELIQLETFATMCYMRFDLLNQKLRILDCGHTNILHFKSGLNKVQKITGENIPLGVLLKTEFLEKSVSFDHEDIFLFYSDGIIEAKNKENVLFGEEQLIDFFQKHHHLPTRKMLEKLQQYIIDFSQNVQDDLTCIAVQIKNIGGHTKFHNIKIIKSRLSEIARARKYIQNTCQNLSYFQENELALQELLLVTNEVLSNIIRHSYSENPNYIIRIEVLTSASFVKIYFVDKGIAFPLPKKNEIENLRDLPVDKIKEMDGGFGMFIIYELVDELSYHRDDKGCNYLCVVKHLN